MKYFIVVKPNAKVAKIEKIDDQHLKVHVKAPPAEGKANVAVIKLLSEYFDVPKSYITLVSGGVSKNKVVEINR